MTESEKTVEQLREEVEQLNSDIIDLQRTMESTHEESGSNSADDNSQEDTADYISRAMLAEQIEEKRRAIAELEELIRTKE